MKIKFLFLIILFAFTNKTIYSQDLIIKRDNSELKAKIIEILENTIKYKPIDFLEGTFKKYPNFRST